MITLGIDNGTTGSIGIITPKDIRFMETPAMKSYLGKARREIKRVDHKTFIQLILELGASFPEEEINAFIERPYTGQFVNAMLPGQRAFEAILVCLEQQGIPYDVIDSKTWQKAILGPEIKGSDALKEASRKKGCQLYPDLSDIINDHGDADGLLIAHHYHVQ